MAKAPPPKEKDDPVQPLPDFITQEPPPSPRPWPQPRPEPVGV